MIFSNYCFDHFSGHILLRNTVNNTFSVETIKAMIVVKKHFIKYSCNEFYNI